MYDALDISRYIINQLNKQECAISNLKLQKLLYFIQGLFLATDGEPCFFNKIEAWDFGPVVPDVYRHYRVFGSNNIPYIEKYVDIKNHDFWNSETIRYDDRIIQEIDKYKIDLILDLFKKYSATQLVNITHQQAPWKNVYYSGRNLEITNKSIKDYFTGRYLKHE